MYDSRIKHINQIAEPYCSRIKRHLVTAGYKKVLSDYGNNLTNTLKVLVRILPATRWIRDIEESVRLYGSASPYMRLCAFPNMRSDFFSTSTALYQILQLETRNSSDHTLYLYAYTYSPAYNEYLFIKDYIEGKITKETHWDTGFTTVCLKNCPKSKSLLRIVRIKEGIVIFRLMKPKGSRKTVSSQLINAQKTARDLVEQIEKEQSELHKSLVDEV